VLLEQKMTMQQTRIRGSVVLDCCQHDSWGRWTHNRQNRLRQRDAKGHTI